MRDLVAWWNSKSIWLGQVVHSVGSMLMKRKRLPRS